MPPALRPSPLRESTTRALFVKIALLFGFSLVVLRLVQIQVVDAAKYKELARRQNTATVPLPALRGVVVDREGRTLISNATLVSFAADPRMVGDSAVQVAKVFADVFQKPRAEYLGKLRKEESRFVWLERRADPRYRAWIPPRRFNGVIVMDEPRRLYHYAHLGGQLLGFTDIDGKGVSGLELALDSLLRGRDGMVVMQRDALNRRRPSVDYPRTEPVDGNSVALTIDMEYQAIVEHELELGVRKNDAESGVAVVLDPKTGEVLAMANYPSIDPAAPATIAAAAARNRVLTDMVEPGSVFKIVTAAAALEHHLVRPDQKFDAEQGEYRPLLPNGKVRNLITDMHKYGVITFREALAVSSNIVFAKISDVIGAENLYTMARRFGFGTETGIGLPGEVSGELKSPSRWSGTTLNTMAYGYEVAATPLQIAAAYGAVANHGVLMKPYVIRQVMDARGEVLHASAPERIREVISRKTADTLTAMFRNVVETGTGQLARVRGVDVAGKTGTARKYVDGRYVPGSYCASFVGYFPASDPAAVCLVMLDVPGTPTYSGGLVSAPIFKGIAEKIAATAARFVARSQGEGALVSRQRPAPDSKFARGTSLPAVSEKLPQGVPAGYAVVPDVTGFPVRRAVNSLVVRQLDAAISGTGIVVAQSPRAGERVKSGSRVTLRCEARNLQLLTLY